MVGTIGLTPVWGVQHVWRYSHFSDSVPHKFLDGAHRAMIDRLGQRATRGDLLVADERELLWLAPEYPGRHYCGHFFLTVDYERRRKEIARFFTAAAEEQAMFLSKNHIRFLFVAARQNPSRFEAVRGLRPILANTAGSLFEYEL
jgi:hypothetical protein